MVEVEQPAPGRPVARPPVGVAHVGDGAAELEALDLVGAAAQWRLGQRLGEVARRPPVFRQHRQAADHQRQLAVLVRLEVEHHPALALGDRVGDVGELHRD